MSEHVYLILTLLVTSLLVLSIVKMEPYKDKEENKEEENKEEENKEEKKTGFPPVPFFHFFPPLLSLFLLFVLSLHFLISLSCALPIVIPILQASRGESLVGARGGCGAARASGTKREEREKRGRASNERAFFSLCFHTLLVEHLHCFLFASKPPRWTEDNFF